MEIIVKKNFTLNNKQYIIGDKLNNITYDEIVKLNEKGFIEPLEYKDLVLIKRELENKKKVKEELL